MKIIDYKWLIIIGLAISIVFIIIFMSSNSSKTNNKYDKKIAILTDSINNITGKLSIYKLDQKELQDQLFVKQQEINNQRIIIKRLKKELNEKADSVYNLPNDKQLEFLSNWLSKRIK